MLKSLFKFFIITIFILSIGLIPSESTSALSGSSFQPGNIIDDSRFFSPNTMSADDIQRFLNAKTPTCDTNGTQIYSGTTTRAARGTSMGYPPPYTCLKDYQQLTVAKPFETGLCNGNVAATKSSAQIIYDVAQSCGINPQVLIVLLQKEQSLLTDDWPWSIQYRSATGYGCPDTAPCDAEYYGYFNQVYSAARQFKRYGKDKNLFNYRSGANNFIQYNPNAGCGGSTVYIQNQATAGLYNYTPYQPNTAALNNLYGSGDGCSAYGNRNFWRLFTDWFGSTTGPPDYSCRNESNITGTGSGGKIVANRFTAGTGENLSLSFMNNTGSKCIELHTWGNNLQSWITNVATNHPVFDSSDGEIISGNVSGDNKSELIFVKYRNTGSGKIEIHTWNPGYQTWSSNIATNYPVSNPADFRVIAADVNADGLDELVLVKYRGTGSGKIEIHTWKPGYQTWISNVATTMPIAESDNGYIIGGNPYGEARDRIMFVKYQNTGSGRIEIHTWNNGYQTWSTNIATNHPVVTLASSGIIAYNPFGEARDRLALVKYQNTGSGRIEVHIWNNGYQTWSTNNVTSYVSL